MELALRSVLQHEHPVPAAVTLILLRQETRSCRPQLEDDSLLDHNRSPTVGPLEANLGGRAVRSRGRQGGSSPKPLQVDPNDVAGDALQIDRQRPCEASHELRIGVRALARDEAELFVQDGGRFAVLA